MHETNFETHLQAQPAQESLVIIALLMRLYDVNLALLNHFDPAKADEIFEHHERGADYNPPIYIPNIKESDDAAEPI